MKPSLPKKLALGLLVIATGASMVILFQFWSISRALAQVSPPSKVETTESPKHAQAAARGNGEHGGEHSAEHEAGHGEGEHGEKAKEEGGHGGGEGAHGAKGANADAGAKSFLVTLEEVVVNVTDAESTTMHTMGLQIDLELFDEEGRALTEKNYVGIKNTIIQTALEQNYQKLSTLTGKLYFKELLVARFNEYFQRAAVRDVHLASFYLQ